MIKELDDNKEFNEIKKEGAPFVDSAPSFYILWIFCKFLILWIL